MERACCPSLDGRMRKVPWGLPINISSAPSRPTSRRYHVSISQWGKRSPPVVGETPDIEPDDEGPISGLLGTYTSGVVEVGHPPPLLPHDPAGLVIEFCSPLPHCSSKLLISSRFFPWSFNHLASCWRCFHFLITWIKKITLMSPNLNCLWRYGLRGIEVCLTR